MSDNYNSPPAMPESEFEKTKPTDEASSVRRWHERIGTSIKYRDRISEEQGWERFLEEYEGKYDVILGGVQCPAINEVFSYVQASISGLYFRDPYIAVNPRKGTTIKAAKILELATNYFWRVLHTKQELELEIIDVELPGHAWHKVGNMISLGGTPDSPSIQNESLYSMRVSWKDMVFALGSRRPPDDCRWMAQRIVLPTETVKDRFPKHAKNIRGGIYPGLHSDEVEKNLFKDDVRYTVLWEVWDRENRKTCLITEGVEKYLEEKPWPGWRREYPYRMLGFNQIPDKPYPMSGIGPWEAQVKEKIKLFTMALNHVKRWNRQLLILKDAMEESEKDKFAQGVDGAIIEVLKAPGEVAVPLAYAPLPPDIYNLMDRLDQIINTTNGMPSSDKGGTTVTKTRTLGELQMMRAGAKSRTDRKIDCIETHCENIARDLIMEMKNNFDMEMVVKITGDTPEDVIQAFGDNFDPASRTISFTKADIQGEFDVDVKAGSTLALDKDTRLDVLSKVLEMGANLPPDLPPFMQVVISEILQGYEIKALEQAFKEQGMQAEEQKAKAQEQDAVAAQKTAAEGKKRDAQTAQITVDTAVKAAQAFGRATGKIPADVSLTK